MSSYYDKETGTTYYDPTMVIEFCQMENLDRHCKIHDMRVFMLYDQDDELIYLYGSRKSDKYPDQITFERTFSCISHLYDFLNISMGFDQGYRVDTGIYCMSGLTNYSDFDSFANEKSKHNEITGYNYQIMTKKTFKKYLNAIF